jgi:hypothetical protein
MRINHFLAAYIEEEERTDSIRVATGHTNKQKSWERTATKTPTRQRGVFTIRQPKSVPFELAKLFQIRAKIRKRKSAMVEIVVTYRESIPSAESPMDAKIPDDKPEQKPNKLTRRALTVVGALAASAALTPPIPANASVADRIARIRTAFAKAETAPVSNTAGSLPSEIAGQPTSSSAQPADLDIEAQFGNFANFNNFTNFSNFKDAFNNFSNFHDTP